MKIKSILLATALIACFACETKQEQPLETKTEQPRENHLMKGNDYLLKSDFDNATAEFDLSIKDSQNAGAFYGKGVIADMQGNHQGAIDLYSKAIELDPKFTLAYYKRANTKKMLGDKSALEDLKKTIELRPDFVAAILDVANQEAKPGKLEDAIIDLMTKSIQLQPNSYVLYEYRGNNRYSKGDVTGAIEDFDQVVKLNPKNSEAYYFRGVLYGEKKEYAKAVADLTKAIELKDGHKTAYLYRGIYNYTLGDNKSACADFMKAKELGETTAQKYIKDYCSENK